METPWVRVCASPQRPASWLPACWRVVPALLWPSLIPYPVATPVTTTPMTRSATVPLRSLNPVSMTKRRCPLATALEDSRVPIPSITLRPAARTKTAITKTATTTTATTATATGATAATATTATAATATATTATATATTATATTATATTATAT